MIMSPEEIERTTLTTKTFIITWHKLYVVNLENVSENLQKNVLLCDLLTAFAKFPKYLLSFITYSTLKSS